jgi:hypothetical protein
MAKGYNQEEGINYEETYAPVARLEDILLLLAFTCCLDFKTLSNGRQARFSKWPTKQRSFVSQPPGFEDLEFPDHIFKLKRALYGLKYAPRAWYERLRRFLLEKNFLVVVLTLLCLVNARERIFYLFKFRLMILFLVLLMKVCVENFLTKCRVSSKCLSWGSSPSSLVYK